MTDYTTEAEELLSEFPDDIDVTVEDLAEEMEQLHQDYSLPMREVRNSMRSRYENSYEGDQEFGRGNNDTDTPVDIAELSPDGDDWVTIEATVAREFDLSEGQQEWIDQRVVAYDDTGEVYVTVPDRAVDESVLEEGEAYEFNTVATETYQGEVSLTVTSASTVTEIEADHERPAGDGQEVTITGAIVNVQDGSGLIKRCAIEDEDGEPCGSALDNDRCPDHGKVDADDHELDLRVLATIDDGTQARNLFFDREATEHLVGIELEEAKQLATETLNTSPIIDDIRKLLTGRFYQITGENAQNVIVTGFELVEEDFETAAEQLINDISTEVEA